MRMEPSERMDASLLSSWNHIIVPLTQEERDRTEMLQSTILSESSKKSYNSQLVKFVLFVSKKDPSLLTEDVFLQLNRLSEKDHKGYIRDYLNIKPRPPTPLLRLDLIADIFVEWVSTMKKSDGVTDMSSSTYNSCRSAVISLFTLFGVPSGNFDDKASLIIRSLKIAHSTTAHVVLFDLRKEKLHSLLKIIAMWQEFCCAQKSPVQFFLMLF